MDITRGLMIYHRWGNADDGTLERCVIVLNFSAETRTVDVPFPANGVWKDLLAGTNVNVGGYWLRNAQVESNWGHVYVQ